MQKPIAEIHHVNRLKKKSCAIISTDTVKLTKSNISNQGTQTTASVLGSIYKSRLALCLTKNRMFS